MCAYRAPGQSKSSTAPAVQQKAAGAGGIPTFTIRYLPAGAKEGEGGRMPWVYLGTIYANVNTYKNDDGTERTATAYSGKSRVAEDDPEFNQTRYKLIVTAEIPPSLEIMEGRRVKKTGAKGNDGREFVGIKDAVLIEMKPMLDARKQPKKKHWEGFDAEHGTWQLLPWQSKEEREARQAEWESKKDKPRVSRAEEVFG